MNMVVIECCRQQTTSLQKDLLPSMSAPPTTNVPRRGSICHKQLLVCAVVGVMLELLQELIGRSLKKTKIHVIRLQRHVHHAKRWLPIYETEKVRCLHCDGFTLTSRNCNANCCKNYGCILQSFEQEP